MKPKNHEHMTQDQKWYEEMIADQETQRLKNANSKEVMDTKRSLGWRWANVAMVALTVTVFCLCWVKVSSIMANKDVSIAHINHGGK